MATSSLFLRSLMSCLFCAALQLSPPVTAQQNAANLQQDIASPSETNPIFQDAVNPSITAAQRAKLEQELHSLLAENSRINQEKIRFLESQSQRVFWTKCLIGFLCLMMLVSLFSFWRLHVQQKFQTGLDSLTTSLRSFQDSLFSLSFIDTSGYSTGGNNSSFQLSKAKLDQLDQNIGLHSPANSRLNSQLNSQLNSGIHRTLNPNTIARGDEFSDIRGFFDAWLNVYKPGDPRYEEALAAANEPESAKPWLQMLDSFRQSNDQSGFETIRKEIKKFFNIKINPWEARPHAEQEQKQLGDYPYIVQEILDLWPSDDVVTYLERLLYNSRMSPREGFEITMFQQLENLLELASRADRPRSVQKLKRIGIADFLFTTPDLASVPTTLPSPATTNPANIANTAVKPQPAYQPKAATASASSTANIPDNNDLTAKQEKISIIEPALAVQRPTTPTETTVNLTAVPTHTLIQTQVQTQAQTQATPSSKQAPVTLANEGDEKTQFNANEVRLKLASAYLEIGD
ncbi:hypothetical protein, partial [Undibacterium sp.]|uniref:hypothetical protein n=1 Tax=Undibacterium sp. TaxID=1914977 RepID=UPI003751236E